MEVPDGTREAIDAFIAGEMSRRRIPGLSLAVVRAGEVAFAAGYGVASLELPAPAKPETVYEIGSLTKQFTAAAVLLLAEDGALRLDDPAGAYANGLPAAWAPISLRHLLAHTSGIPEYLNAEDIVRFSREEHTPAEVIALVADRPLDFIPGTAQRYSNTGYYLLGLAIEAASGVDYFEFLSQRIFDPLGMNATRGADPREVVAGRAAGYGWERNAHRNCAPLTPTAAFSAGSLLSTAGDLTLWDAALRGDSLLPRARREEMWTGATLADGSTARYGYGWGVHPDYLGRRLVEHSGGTGGFSSHLARFLDDDLSVIVLANLRAVETREIAREVAGLTVPALKPPPPAPVEDKEPGVAELVAEVLRAVADGSLGPERFTPDLWASIFPDRVREGAGALAPLGVLESVTLTAVGQATDGAGQRSYRYHAAFAGGDILVMLRIGPDGRISGLQFAPG